MLDALDRRIVAALQINGRAPWGMVARAVGSTESTVARRAQRMSESGQVRVVGMIDPVQCGFGRPVLLQLRCESGTAVRVADVLAARPEVRFVALTAGTYDLLVELIVTSRAHLARLLLSEVQAAAGVRDVVVASVLRKFKVSYDWGRRLLGDSVDEVAAPPLPSADTPAPVHLDQVDLAAIAALRENGRRSFADLAADLGVTEVTVQRRVNRLLATGALACGPLVDPELLGFEVEVFCWLRVNPTLLEHAAAELGALPEVRYLSATTGFADLACEVVLAGYDDLYDFTTHRLGSLPGFIRAETSIELGTVKRAFLRADAPVGHDGEPQRQRQSGGTKT
jgi:DNA-binding Lrp family transcriptional regulator